MRRRPTLVERFRVEPPPSVQLFAELMRARGEQQRIIAARRRDLIETGGTRVSSLDLVRAARAVQDARAAWHACHGVAS